LTSLAADISLCKDHYKLFRPEKQYMLYESDCSHKTVAIKAVRGVIKELAIWQSYSVDFKGRDMKVSRSTRVVPKRSLGVRYACASIRAPIISGRYNNCTSLQRRVWELRPDITANHLRVGRTAEFQDHVPLRNPPRPCAPSQSSSRPSPRLEPESCWRGVATTRSLI
jgi:hypothetical protein